MEVMRVEFTKHEKNGRVACAWTATRGKRTEVPGSYMPAGKDIPHDLGQYVVEAATGYTDGFWGLIDRGATFKSTGRKSTRPGRAIIRDHRAELDASEGLAGAHLAAWRAGEISDVGGALTVAYDQWQALSPGEHLVFEWPSPAGSSDGRVGISG